MGKEHFDVGPRFKSAEALQRCELAGEDVARLSGAKAEATEDLRDAVFAAWHFHPEARRAFLDALPLDDRAALETVQEDLARIEQQHTAATEEFLTAWRDGLDRSSRKADR